MKKVAIVSLLVIMPIIQGCAVGMALHGRPDVDLSALRVGQPRDEVIIILGQPIKTMTTDIGRIDVFECQRGNAPSTGRAVAHGAMDLLTFGAWEIIGTPIEALGSSKFRMTINYNKEDKVTKIITGDAKGGLD